MSEVADAFCRPLVLIESTEYRNIHVTYCNTIAMVKMSSIVTLRFFLVQEVQENFKTALCEAICTSPLRS